MPTLYDTFGRAMHVYDTSGRLVWGETGVTPPDALNTAWHGERSATIQPTWDHTIRVGEGREYTTIQSAVTAARAWSHSNAGEHPRYQFHNAVYRSGRPGHWRTLILLDPGTYTVSILDLGGGVDLMGDGDTRDAVTVQTDGTTGGRYALRAYDGLYCANLTLRHVTGANGNNYPFHGSDSDASALTAIFDNVHFFEDNPGAASGIAGWDMPNGLTAQMYRCEFTTTSESYSGVNFHDMPGNTLGVTCDFIECVSDYPMRIKNTNGEPRNDHWTNWACTRHDGTPWPDVEAINGGAETPITAAPAPIVGGMTDAERAKYEPVAAAGTVITPTHTDPHVADVPTGTTWALPLGALSHAALASTLRATVESAGEGVVAGLWIGTEAGPTYALLWPRWTTATGTVTMPTTRWTAFLDRDPTLRYWLGVTVKAGARMTVATVPGALAVQTATPAPGLEAVPPGLAPASGPVPLAAAVADAL